MAFLTVHVLSIISVGMFLDPSKDTVKTPGPYVCMSDIRLLCARVFEARKTADFYMSKNLILPSSSAPESI